MLVGVQVDYHDRMFKNYFKVAVRNNEPIDARIIGVVKDYNFESLSQKIQPEQHRLATKYLMNFMFKVQRGQTRKTIAKIEKEWKDITQNYPFEYTFLDQTIAKMYEPQMRW